MRFRLKTKWKAAAGGVVILLLGAARGEESPPPPEPSTPRPFSISKRTTEKGVETVIASGEQALSLRVEDLSFKCPEDGSLAVLGKAVFSHAGFNGGEPLVAAFEWRRFPDGKTEETVSSLDRLVDFSEFLWRETPFLDSIGARAPAKISRGRAFASWDGGLKTRLFTEASKPGERMAYHLLMALSGSLRHSLAEGRLFFRMAPALCDVVHRSEGPTHVLHCGDATWRLDTGSGKGECVFTAEEAMCLDGENFAWQHCEGSGGVRGKATSELAP